MTENEARHSGSSADESSDDDEDYCPEADSKRIAELSEEDESGNESNGDEDDDEQAGTSKRKRSNVKRSTGAKKGSCASTAANSRKRKAAGNNEDNDPDVSNVDDLAAPATAAGTDTTEEQREKARADALWADFLTDADPPTRPKPVVVAAEATAATKPSTSISTNRTTAALATAQPAVKKQIVTETVEYAGEKIEITKEVLVATTAKPASSSASNGNSLPAKKLTPGPAGRRPANGGGLSAILSQMNKPKKIGTLEKTKLDWTSFKRKEGIEEQLQTHNRGKDGYLERQDFLQRTDLRQFDIEKDLRQTSSRRGK